MDSITNDDSWQTLHQRLRGISKRRAALDAEEARCLREAVAIRLWRRLGYVHVNEYLERELGYAPQVGAERIRVAQALAQLPRIEASLGMGALPFSAVRELTRVATPDTELAWLDAAHGKNLRQVEAMVSGKKPGDRPDDPARPELVNRILRLELSPSAFAAFRQVQAAMADEHGSRLDDSTLIEILCRRALEGGVASERPAHQIALTVCESCGRGWQNGAGREIEVGPEVVDRARCDAELIGSLDASVPERMTSTITPRVRRQVLARDQHRCAVPGCRSARNLDVHHLRFRSEGGGNELSNLLTMCSGHHALLHAGQLLVLGEAPHALRFSWREAPERATAEARSNDARGTARKADDEASWNAAYGPARRSAPVPETSSTTNRRDVSLEHPREPAPARAGCVDLGGSATSFGHGAPAVRTPAGSSVCDGRGPVPDAKLSDSARTPSSPQPASDVPHEEADIAAVDGAACSALAAAGFKLREARAAVALARPHVGAEATLDQLLREALRCCRVPHAESHAPWP